MGGLFSALDRMIQNLRLSLGIDEDDPFRGFEPAFIVIHVDDETGKRPSGEDSQE